MFAAAFAAAALAMAPQAAPGQDAVAAGDPVALEDVVVQGRTLDTLIRNFVGQVAAPNRDRGLAMWRDSVCVGVANLEQEAAQYIADRVSTVAADLGIRTGGDNCAPNILVVATDDGEALSRALVAERPRAFRMGSTGMDRGRAALGRFQEGAKPVRWWQMAMPVDSETGARAVRISGECANECISPEDMAPKIFVQSASRMHTQIIDNLSRSIVVVDVTQLPANVTILQLADYIAMVSLAQIDPEADTSAYASILNVFEEPDTSPSLTQWDLAYLEGLYRSEQFYQNRRAGRSEVSRSIHRAHAELRTAEDGAQE